MNRRMLSRSQGGFTTCVVLRIEPQGTVIVANAGHLAPYLAGRRSQSKMAFPSASPPTPGIRKSVFNSR